MQTNETFIDHADVARSLGELTAQRGMVYHRQGRVTVTDVMGPFEVSGKVRGRTAAAYSTRVTLTADEDGWFVDDSECSCPMGTACKHVAALLYAAVAQHEGRAAVGTKVSTPRPISPLTWLRAAAETVAPEPSPGVEYPASHILYLLTCEDMLGPQATLELTMHRGRHIKSGGYGRLTPVRIDSRSTTFAYGERDLAAVRGVLSLDSAATPWSYYVESVQWPLPIVGAQSAPVLRSIVATGRAYFTDVDSRPLRWGPDRVTQLCWQRQTDGSQRLGTTLDAGIFVVGTEPVCYLDTKAGMCGRLHLPVPESLVHQLNEAPPVGLQDVKTFCASIPRSLAEVIPAPRDLEIIDQAMEPVPELVLEPATDGGKPTRARLTFNYGSMRVDPSDPGATEAMYVEEDGVLRRTSRNHDAEAAHGLRLQAAGAVPAGDEATYTLAAASNLQAMFDMHSRLQPLRDAGWTLTSDLPLPARVVEVDTPWDMRVQDEGAEGLHWFSLEMGIDIDGVRRDLVPILASALRQPALGLDLETLRHSTSSRIYIPIDDTVTVSIPKARLTQIMGVLVELYSTQAQLGPAQATEVLNLVDAGGATLRGEAGIVDLAQRLRACEGIQACAAPAGLRAQLRPYQMQGLSWLQFLRTYNLAGILADDMGLGKTLQALAHILTEKEAGRLQQPALVVVPTSLLFNWQDEAQRFAPSLVVETLYGAERQSLKVRSGVDVLLTTYGTLLRDIEVLSLRTFHLMVLDESQVIKNPRSKLHAAVLEIKATHRICMTGTPMENHLTELWAQFNFLLPSLLQDQRTFKKTFRDPIEKDRDPNARARLQHRIRPFLLRRTKDQVAKELPPKTEVVQHVTFERDQRDLYEAVRAAVDERVREEIAGKGLARSSIVILDALLKLRQACCDPRLVKLSAARRVKGSAKLSHLTQLVQQLVGEGRRILVFSQFSSMLELIGETLGAHHIGYTKLTGETHNRQAAVETFQAGDVPVMLVSLKAGGTGLNLTRADTVIHYDPWWNPAAERQATDRAHRIGQDKAVFVYKLIVSGSVEEKILEMQRRKDKIAEALLGAETLGTLFTQDDLQNLLAPLQ